MAGIGEQVPRWPATSHAVHGSAHVWLQHTRSTHKVDAHSPAAAHEEPTGFKPQEPWLQVPELHWVDAVQVVRQAVPLLAHTNGIQVADTPRLQDPAPSHVDCPVSVLVAASQRAGAHITFFQSRQAPWPSHMPSVPQVACDVRAQPV